MITKLSQKLALAITLFFSHFTIASNIDPYLTLSPPTLTNGQVQFSLNGEPDIPCVIESSPDLANWTPVSTNTDYGPSRVVTLEAVNGAKFYRAVIPSFPLFGYALAAQGNINLSGTGLVTDSFNSMDPNFSTDGQYDAAKASNHGDIASVGGIVNLGSHTISGNVFLGPFASFASPTNQISGGLYNNRLLYFPNVQLPSASPIAAPIVNSTNLLTVSGYYFIANLFPIDVAPGITVQVLTTNANLASIVIHGGTTNSGTAYIYLAGTSANVAGNTAIDSSKRARNLIYLGLPSLTSISVGGAANDIIAAIYAPSASVSLNAGGAINAIYGSCIAQTITLNGHYTVHFDEDLLNLDQFP